jgi:hypothetical protein
MEIMPSASTRDARSLVVANWDTTSVENTRNGGVAPTAHVRDGRRRVVARKSRDSPANRPLAEKAPMVAAAAGTASLTETPRANGSIP